MDARPPTRWFASTRDDAIAGLCGAWMVIGLFADGWAHRNQKPETFFSPWHGLLYSGFVASAVWMLRVARRGQARGLRGRAALPVGYDVRLAGVAVFGLGGLGDFAWHSIFGIEVSVEALLSPPHLVLLSGGLLMAIGPIVSSLARSEPSVEHRHDWGTAGPIVGALTFIVSVIGFFLMYLSPYDRGGMGGRRGAGLDARTYNEIYADSIARAIGGIVITSVITALAIAWLVRAHRVPRGGLLLLMVVPPVLQSALSSFDQLHRVAGALVAGVIAEITYPTLRRHVGRHSDAALAAWVGALTLVTWFGYAAAIATVSRIAWSPELWSGSAVLAALLSALTIVASAPAPRRVAPEIAQ